MSDKTLTALFDDMARLKARLPYHMELRMNETTLEKLGKASGTGMPDPALSGISSFMGIPIRIREYMYDNKVGIAKFDDKGNEISYEVIEAFKLEATA